MIIIPAIDLRSGRCVRLTQGRKQDTKVYDEDPVALALRYQAEGATWLHLVDLDGAFSDPNSDNRRVVSEIVSQVKIPVQFGGGLRSLADLQQVIELGVSRTILGTLAVEAPDIVTAALRLYGPKKLAVGIDARDGRVMTRGWNSDGGQSALELAQGVGGLGIERIIYTDIARDGMLSGINLEQTRLIARESGLKVTASGGVSSLADLEQLKPANEDGVDSVIVGKALYEGRFTLAEALAGL